MKYREAYLCLECEEIMTISDYDKDMDMARCYKCSSKKVVPLSQWLYKNRRPEKQIRQTPTAEYKSINTPTPYKKG